MTATARAPVAFVRIALALTIGAALPVIPPALGHDRPGPRPAKTRSAVLARNGMAATSHPLAAQAAIRVLQEGGNAIDAAIAANAVIGVVEPMSCGIGGDLYAIVWDARNRELVGLNASGRMPGKATREWFRGQGLREVPVHGPLSWSVPGCVDGWDMLKTRFGTKDWPALLEPAIRLAEEGFPVSEIIARDWNAAAARLREVPTSAACYLPDGRAPRMGEIFRNPQLAASLRAIAEGGRDAFYDGPVARAIAAYSAEVGGLLSAEDLRAHRGNWVAPVSVNYRGYDIWELPPNGQGVAALQMLNLLEPHDLRALGHNSAKTLHLMIEAKKLAYEDRAKHYTDLDFMKFPVERLISKEYAAERARLIDPARANPAPAAGDLPGTDTIYLTVVDKDMNAVSLIQSIFHGFGSFHVPGELGFCLQNRGSLVALDDDHANRLEPGKRPFQTIIPGFVTKDGEPWLSFGVMGGDMQPQGHVQALVNMIDFDMDPQDAGDAPRWRHLGSSEPTGRAAEPGGGTVVLESGIGPGVREALRAMGHRVDDSAGAGGYGGYQAIRIDARRRVLVGGSDPRKDGCAIGY